MPAFVVLPDPGGGLKGGPPAWGSGFLPATYQGTTMRAGEHPILDLKSPHSSARQRATLDLIQQMNAAHLARHEGDSVLDARIRAYELAFRMQSAAPEAVDISRETEATKHLYGIDHPTTKRVRHTLPARTPHDRARRAFRAALLGRYEWLGCARERPEESHRLLPPARTSPWPV
jgi:hypothetical protein